MQGAASGLDGTSAYCSKAVGPLWDPDVLDLLYSAIHMRLQSTVTCWCCTANPPCGKHGDCESTRGAFWFLLKLLQTDDLGSVWSSWRAKREQQGKLLLNCWVWPQGLRNGGVSI